jgi:hypothetical protein
LIASLNSALEIRRMRPLLADEAGEAVAELEKS